MFDGIHSWYLFRAACDCLLVPPAPGPLQAHPARYLVGGDQEELKAFLAIIDGDSGLQAKLLAVRSSDDILSMIKEYGWPSIADQNSFLSDAEIESVAGGLAVMSLGGWITCD